MFTSFYYPLEVCLFSNERQQGSGFGWEGMWEAIGISRERDNHNQDILYEQKINVFNKRHLSRVAVIWWLPGIRRYTSRLHLSCG